MFCKLRPSLNISRAEFNANKQQLSLELICIEFGTQKGWNWALKKYMNKMGQQTLFWMPVKSISFTLLPPVVWNLGKFHLIDLEVFLEKDCFSNGSTLHNLLSLLLLLLLVSKTYQILTSTYFVLVDKSYSLIKTWAHPKNVENKIKSRENFWLIKRVELFRLYDKSKNCSPKRCAAQYHIPIFL